MQSANYKGGCNKGGCNPQPRIVYVFAVLFAQAVHDHTQDPNMPPLSEAADEARKRYFGSLLDTMLSLFMSIAGGVSWEHVIFPLKAVNTIWVVCFLFYASWQQQTAKENTEHMSARHFISEYMPSCHCLKVCPGLYVN